MRDFLHCVVETVTRTEYNKISETRAMLFKTIWQPFTGCFLVSSQFRLRRFFSGSVHCSWVHCHLASVSLDFASLIYRVWLRSLRLSLSCSLFRICPFHFRKHHIDSSVHALWSLSLCHSFSTSSIIFFFFEFVLWFPKENQNTHERIFLDQLGYRFLFSYTASAVAAAHIKHAKGGRGGEEC